jgi:hypothetical protein
LLSGNILIRKTKDRLGVRYEKKVPSTFFRLVELGEVLGTFIGGYIVGYWESILSAEQTVSIGCVGVYVADILMIFMLIFSREV